MVTSREGSLTAQAVLPDLNFQILFETIPGLYLVLTPLFEIVAVSNAYLDATMTRREAILGRNIFDVFPDDPDDPDATGVRNLRSSLERALLHSKPDAMAIQKYDVRRPEAKGGGFEERYWSPLNAPVIGPNNEVLYIIHRVEDVTEFIHLKERGIEHEKITANLLIKTEHMEAEIFQRSKTIEEVNRQLHDAKNALEERVQKRTAELAQANDALREEIRLNKLLEEKFQQAQKMEIIGKLSSGIAHDFNNLLTVILGCSDMLLEHLHSPAGSEVGTLIEQIQTAGNRASSMTNQLLAFSRQQILEPKIVDLNALVKDTKKILCRLIGEDIEFNTVLDPALLNIRADPNQLVQIIMNLAINARDAMPQGGKLFLETANVTLSNIRRNNLLILKPQPYILLSVTDNGCGMDELTQSRIFEPFFTTKGMGKGTGLGLATVFSIVEQNRGHIEVTSTPGEGSIFKVFLPAVQESMATKQTTSSHNGLLRGNETILVVEDDSLVRTVTVLGLKSFGYNVLQASNAQDALTICKNNSEKIHLLVSDVIMPDIGGRQLAEIALSLRPDIKVVYVSGYTDDAVMRYGIFHEEVAFLQKPFTPDKLAKKIREVLDTA